MQAILDRDTILLAITLHVSIQDSAERSSSVTDTGAGEPDRSGMVLNYAVYRGTSDLGSVVEQFAILELSQPTRGSDPQASVSGAEKGARTSGQLLTFGRRPGSELYAIKS